MTTLTNRKKSRKLLFQQLYSMCFNDFNQFDFNESFFDNTFKFSRDDKYLDEMIRISTHYESVFIKLIESYSPRFDISKMNINYILPIYIALGEMLYFSEEIPAKVSINEAVEIAKVYGDDSAKKIVNGVLNKVLEDIETISNEKDKYIENINKFSIFKK